MIFKKEFNRVASFFENAASHPLFGGGAAVMTIMAGSMASFFTDDIKKNLTPFWASGNVSIEASAFWFCIFLAGIFLGLGQWAQTRKIS